MVEFLFLVLNLLSMSWKLCSLIFRSIFWVFNEGEFGFPFSIVVVASLFYRSEGFWNMFNRGEGDLYCCLSFLFWAKEKKLFEIFYFAFWSWLGNTSMVFYLDSIVYLLSILFSRYERFYYKFDWGLFSS
jgi:hypothetical protein